MKTNVGSIDKIIRIIIAIILAGLYFSNIVISTPGIVLVVISIVLILTSSVSFCPLYLPFNISTKRKKS